MKRLFLLLTLICIVNMGCSENEIDSGNSNNTEQPEDNPDDNTDEEDEETEGDDGKDDGNDENNDDGKTEELLFYLNKDRIAISPDGGSVDIIVYSNFEWEIYGSSDWCTPSVIKGEANEDGQNVSFSAGVAYDNRDATFWFYCADEKIKLIVTQSLKEVIIADENNSLDIPAEGGVAEMTYKTSVECEVVIPDEAQNWISFANTRALVSKSITLDVAKNTTYSTRTAIVKVVARDNSSIYAEYTINQEQATYQPNPDPIEFNAFVENATRTGTRATSYILNAFDVWGWMDNASGDILIGEDVTKMNDAWSYDNTQYWTPDHYYTFHAVAPMNSHNWTYNLNNKDNGDDNTINFKNENGTEDLLLATSTQSTMGYGAEYDYEAVTFQFNHLLSKVMFTFKNGFTTGNYRIRVKDIRMMTCAEASYDIANAEWGEATGEIELSYGDTPIIEEEAQSSAERLIIPTSGDKDYTFSYIIDVYYGDNLIMDSVEITAVINGNLFKAGWGCNIVTELNPQTIGHNSTIEFAIELLPSWSDKAGL